MSEDGPAEAWIKANQESARLFDKLAIQEVITPSLNNRFYYQPLPPGGAVLVFGAATAVLDPANIWVPLASINAAVAISREVSIDLIVFLRHFQQITDAELEAAKQRNPNTADAPK